MLACPNIPDIVEAAIIAVFKIFLLFIMSSHPNSRVVTTEQPVSEGVFFVQIKCDIFYGSADNKMALPITFRRDWFGGQNLK